jgi:phosphoribosyl-ATP pyrophosphohydrolase
MTFSYATDVRAWHVAMRLPGMQNVPCIPDGPSRALGAELVREEYSELIDALIEVERSQLDGRSSVDEMVGDLAKEALDLVWVVLGLLHRFGVPVDECWAELCRSNGSKSPAHVAESGKLEKGPDYRPADMASIVRRARVDREEGPR